MRIPFSKYHGLGNDFVIIDNTRGSVSLSLTQRRLMCSRRYGVGADGLIMVESSKEHSFALTFYDNDGTAGALCGNGCRCTLAFAQSLGLVEDKTFTFEAYDGVHTGRVVSKRKCVLGFKDRRFEDIKKLDNDNFFVDTGAPHHVRYVDSITGYDVVGEGRQLRYGKYEGIGGANVTFVDKSTDGKMVCRMYDRRIDEEVPSCGTVSVAIALIAQLHRVTPQGHVDNIGQRLYETYMEGGPLTVTFDVDEDIFTNIELTGDVEHVFDGTYYF
ncbi:diaminopimelate epimerase-like [Haliotis rubra]|uniref:diaminopimelate epimerase-like n=1 Tax=Haliotis rubra TaxID=36100 RepID=UPI001EE5624A|nr:diaminopimelate epimerase-like [Haliotis rubra]